MEGFYLDPVVYTGSPENLEDRPEKEARCYRLLDELGISYTRMDHDPANTMEECKAVEEKLGIEICKNLFLTNRQKTEFYLLVMPGDKPFRTSVFSKALGVSRLSFGPAEEMERFLDITPGSVSILGLMNDRENRVQLVFDEDVLKKERFGCHPCRNTASLCLGVKDVIEKFLPRVGHPYRTVALPAGTEE